ncbi:methyltransferase domain protein [Anaerococcus lactolyticus ATCC 51172]|uniref:Methyltransferase domain protein n=1 Tax=Anaerococcus lactolyticus ATCC 51172 TaxID=525254 RepID=C2BIM4_9FIRM|nr:class I SAM-dependent methyltransferase [Anaerococcus lactolyticus]EEI85276.1 methyltransferase domain protein [Anaerococcus lactolyticus ATCC 51172]
MKAKFDGLANKYDQWFMENENMYLTELNVVEMALKSVKTEKSLSVGCGSGLFEVSLKDRGLTITDGLEPSKDMAEIAEKRGLNVKIGIIEDAKLEDEYYDCIYLNGSSTYIEDLESAYKTVYKALKPGGHIVVIDVPKESSFGILYQFAAHAKTFDLANFEGILPKSPYPIELVTNTVMTTTPYKRDVLKKVGFKDFKFYQTLTTDPAYSDDYVEEAQEGYDKGSYVAIVGQK